MPRFHCRADRSSCRFRPKGRCMAPRSVRSGNPARLSRILQGPCRPCEQNSAELCRHAFRIFRDLSRIRSCSRPVSTPSLSLVGRLACPRGGSRLYLSRKLIITDTGRTWMFLSDVPALSVCPSPCLQTPNPEHVTQPKPTAYRIRPNSPPWPWIISSLSLCHYICQMLVVLLHWL